MPDQLRADAVGCFGQPVASTPNIDALAHDGMRFTNAFANHPVCGPSRVSLMTGWYPHTNGNRTLTNLIKPYEPNMLRYLKDDGYTVVWAGLRGDTFAPGVTEASTSFAGFVEPPTSQIGQFTRERDVLWNLYYDGRRPDDVHLDFDEATIRTAISVLDDPPPEPWCLFVPLFFPHPPFQVEDPWYSQHDPADMPTPAGLGSGPKPAFQAILRDRYGSAAVRPEQWAEISRTYYGMVSRVDHQLGRLRDAVDAAGKTPNTAWMFFTDHGEYLGDRGLTEKWPSGLDNCLLHNPLIISTPDGPTNASFDGFVELMDLMPTVLDLAGVSPKHTHYARSLLPVLAGDTKSHREAAFSEGGFNPADADQFETVLKGRYAIKTATQQDHPEAVAKAISVRTSDWTYIYRQTEQDELYSRTNDPHELHNVAGEQPAVIAEHRDQLLDWLVETGDVIRWEKDARFPQIEPGWR